MNLPELDLEDLGFAEGAHLLVKRALAALPVGGELRVRGRAPMLAIDLGAWCRKEGHALGEAERGEPYSARVRRGGTDTARFSDAERAGGADASRPGAVVASPPARWGLAARGALVEKSDLGFHFPLHRKSAVWADEAARLYAQATAAQWDPAAVIAWSEAIDNPPEVEDAVVQLMTYLVENETAALVVPARFLAQLHPHFREVMQLLALQTADEARHIEVFTRRALLQRSQLGLSTAGGQASLKTLLDEPDFSLAVFLLSVLGEGSFLSLLWFLWEKAPDAVTREVARFSAQDEARHVAFGLAHLERHVGEDASLRPRLARAVERRHAELTQTAGLNDEVFDALVTLAAGSWEIAAVRRGHAAVMQLVAEMDAGRRQRLRRLGFTADEAEALSALHTRNFM